MMHAEIEKFLDSIPDIQKEKAADDIIVWRVWSDIIAVERLPEPSREYTGYTSIKYDEKFYNQDEFLKLLKMKAFW